MSGQMSKGFRVGSLFGFPIRVHLSFLALLAVVLVFMGGVPGVLSVLVIAASVVLHELGHAPPSSAGAPPCGCHPGAPAATRSRSPRPARLCRSRSRGQASGSPF